MSERQIAVYNQYRNAQDKHTYFLLAAVGAAIGFALRETVSAPLQWSEVPLAIAVLCWLLSFYCGCKQSHHTVSGLYSNFELLTVQAGEHVLTGIHPEKIAIASEELKRGIAKNSSNAEYFGKTQFRLLLWGAIFYIGWHIWEMWVRTP